MERRVATQLIVFGPMARKDLEGVMEAVADAGYDGAETGILSDQLGARSLARLMARHGLALASCHANFAQLENASAVLDYILEAGSKYLICSGVGDRGAGMEAYQAAADLFNRVGETAREKGAVFCYHNHSWEFEKFGGETGLDVLYQRTDPELVKLCVDTFWVADGGEDPAVFLHRHRKRLGLVHLKDGKPGIRTPEGKCEFLELGTGHIDVPAVMKILDLTDLEWVTVEQDSSVLPPSASIRRSREYLREIGY